MFKKVLLALSFIVVCGNAPIKADGEYASVGVGIASGICYEKLLHHAPYWASVPGIPLLLFLHAKAFSVARQWALKGHNQSPSYKPDFKAFLEDRFSNLRLTFFTALMTAVVAYALESDKTEKQEDKKEEPVVVASTTKEAGLV